MVCVAEEPTCDRLSAGPERRGRRIGRGLATAPPSVLRIGSPSVQEWLEQAATGLGALSSGVFGDGTGNFEVGLARVEIASEGCRASRPHQRPYPASGPALTLPALIYGSITLGAGDFIELDWFMYLRNQQEDGHSQEPGQSLSLQAVPPEPSAED